MLDRHLGLYTDMYQLAMGQAYVRNGTAEAPAVFDYFFRRLPYEGGYVVFAGLDDVLDLLEQLRFEADDLAYLASLGFEPFFLDYLRDFRFAGSVFSAREGDVVFPVEPVLRVEGRLFETQLAETLLLNVLNFESLIATKAARLRLAAGNRLLSEFGLRRAHGPGGILASRAAVIGGCETTSNVYAAFRYGLRPAGTMAHSYIESHTDELAAFRAFAAAHPRSTILLVDTYDTLRSGVPNAIIVAREMKARGENLVGVRLDSGDLAYLSKRTRRMLDEAGFPEVKIVVSNLLDEHLIKSLLDQSAPIDIFGVGTRLATGAPDGALDGIYKLSSVAGRPCLKLSETIAKTTLPGRKKVIRFAAADGPFQADAVVLAEEQDVDLMFHPTEPGQSLALGGFAGQELLVEVMAGGKRLQPAEPVESIARFARERLARLPAEHRRFENPHVYKVGLSRALRDLRDGLAHGLSKEG
ncbi:MAG: nicotinate phosphoribosyltransferase [Candidatus Aminicenantes bacterium]|nr:nicotinate phosphoribosyltransferase [Candidatus Aminicenantes bacterium]